MAQRPPPPMHGVLGLLVLAVLAKKGEAHGYEIMKSIEEITDGLWRPAPGSLYPLLMSLESEGLIECRSVGEGRVRRVCTMTPEGVRYFIEEVGRRFERVVPIATAVVEAVNELVRRGDVSEDEVEGVIKLICRLLSRFSECVSKLCVKASDT